MERMPGSSHADVGVTQAVADIGRGVDALERLLAMQRETIGVLGSQLDPRTRSVLEPLMAELSLMRQSNERQAQQLIGQAEMIGSLTEQVDGRERELDRSSAEIAALSGRLAEADVSRRRYVGIANALAIVLVVAGAFAAMAWLP